MPATKQIQLILLPKGDILKPLSYFAFCPYSKIIGEGKTIDDAIENWQHEAENHFNFTFQIPHKLSTRKVLYSETTNNSPIYLLDFNPASKLSSMLFSSSTKKTTEDKDSIKELGMVFDWRVNCTPVYEVEECMQKIEEDCPRSCRDRERREFISLTPNVCN